MAEEKSSNKRRLPQWAENKPDIEDYLAWATHHTAEAMTGEGEERDGGEGEQLIRSMFHDKHPSTARWKRRRIYELKKAAKHAFAFAEPGLLEEALWEQADPWKSSWLAKLSGLLARWEENIQQQREQILASLAVVNQPQWVTRGNVPIPPMIGFTQTEAILTEEGILCDVLRWQSFTLHAYLPAPRYLSILQLGDDNETEPWLLYPADTTQMMALEAGSTSLFDVRFEQVGTTRFLALFSSSRLQDIDLVFGTHELESAQTWPAYLQQKLSEYLLSIADTLEFFVLRVKVQ